MYKKNVCADMGGWGKRMKTEEENRKTQVDAIMKRAVDILITRTTGNTDGKFLCSN